MKEQQIKEISLVDFIYYASLKINLLVKIFLAIVIIGILVACLLPRKYQAESKIITESEELNQLALSNGLNALKGIGLNIGMTASGLIPEVYPEIIKSKEVIYNVLHTQYFFSDEDTTRTLLDYLTEKNFFYYLKRYTIKLPKTLFRIIVPKKKLEFNNIKTTKGIIFLTKDEQEAINILLDDYLNVNLDLETGIIYIDIKSGDPLLSAQIDAKITESLVDRIRNLAIEKNKLKLNFIKERLNEIKKKLDKAEQNIVDFIEKNNEPKSIELQIKLDRLQKKASFYRDIYYELQLQYTQTEIELKKQEPIVRVLEAPSPPYETSGISRIIIIIAFVFLGFFIVFIIILFDIIKNNLSNTENTKLKLQMIRKNFSNLNILKFK